MNLDPMENSKEKLRELPPSPNSGGTKGWKCDACTATQQLLKKNTNFLGLVEPLFHCSKELPMLSAQAIVVTKDAFKHLVTCSFMQSGPYGREKGMSNKHLQKLNIV